MWITKMENQTTREVLLSRDTFYPSSKMCSHCGSKTEVTNNLSIRNWECANCDNKSD